MNRTEFDTLVRRIETATEGRPRRLRLSVALWVLLGYSGFLSLLALVWLAGGGLIFAGIFTDDNNGGFGVALGAAVLVFGSAAALRHLWISISPPTGVALEPEQAGALRGELQKLTAEFRARPLHRILLTSECNAAVCEVPRLGLLGWPRSYLMLGLPLMDELTPEEFRAVLAHEIAHLSRRHGRFSSWIYRVRRTWERVIHEFNSSPGAEGRRRRMMRAFLRWYWPRFNARAFVLSRRCEYEADAAAASWTGGSALSTGLLRLRLVHGLLEGTVSRALHSACVGSPEPPADFTDLIRAERARPENAADLETERRAAFLIPTGNSDTHPCLAERSRAVGAVLETGTAPPAVPPPAEPSAAEFFLGQDLAAARAAVNALWQKNASIAWSARHHAAADHARGAAMLEDSVIDAGSVERLCDEVRNTTRLHGLKTARPLLERILDRNRDHIFANLTLAELLIETGETGTAEACLLRVLANPAADPDAPGHMLHDIYRRAGRHEELVALQARLDREDHSREAAAKERSSVTAADSFKPHTLTDAELLPLWELLRGESGLRRVTLAEKVLHHQPSKRLFVLCLHGRGGKFGMGAASRAAEAARRLTPRIRLPGRLLVVAAGGPLGAIARKIDRVPESEIVF